MQRAGLPYQWLCYGARDITAKILAIVGPITAFALGPRFSSANMYLIPIGMLAGTGFDAGGSLRNLFWVTLGNIVGGAGGVALVYSTMWPSTRPDWRGFCRRHRLT